MGGELYHLLFIDDDMDFLHSMKMAISSKPLVEGNSVEIESHFLSDPQEGLAFTQELAEEEEKIAVIVSDQQMPDLTGIEFIEKANGIVPKAVKMLLTGYASLDSAKYAINNHILDQYISKPIEDYDHFTCLIKNAIKTFHSVEENERAENEIKHYVRELEEKNERIKSMHRAAEKIAYLAQGFRKLDLDEVLDLIINRLPSVFNAKYSSLFLLNEENDALEMVRSNYLNETFKKDMCVDDVSPMMVALKENRVIVLPEIQKSPFEFLEKKCLGSSCIIIPFVLGGDQKIPDMLGKSDVVKGVLNMANIDEMEAEDIVKYTASLIRNILGINILNARLYQKTRRLALIDGLTGLYNKHIFMEFLRKECDYCERHGNPLHLAILDVDDFKAINDTHGHRVGDEVLTHLGRLFKRAARKSDVFARYGGEEFAWLIQGDDGSKVLSALDRLRSEVAKSSLPADISLTVSIGFTRFAPESGDTLEEFIDRADGALYQAK